MREFSRETLLNIIETDHVQCGEASALARMALAAMDSEPVALQPELAKVIYHFRDWNEGFPVERFKADYVISWMLANYPPAQPAPVVPELRVDWQENEFSAGWNACRAAMLQAGNSPVIPEGYVMVPKVPSQAHLNSIAMRYRHDFYLLNDAQKDSALATARQMYEECSGQGFYTLPAAPQEVKGEHRIRDEMDMGARMTSHRFKV
ncbi:TPA: hypothetical protein ACJI3O_003395 [Raoultella ornithinolytica]